jgi:tRNA (guanine37-N1)-methyltransferase
VINFHIITIFPKILDSYFGESILARAQKDELIKISLYNLRDFTTDKHHKTDYKPYAGGPGLVMFAEPILKAVDKIKSKIKSKKVKVIIFYATGKQFDNKQAISWAKKYTDIIMICGRYEGIDARVKKILRAEEVSIGPYILTGGELPAAILVDSISRQIPGVLGNEDSPEEKRICSSETYTRPEVLEYKGKKYRVPKILLSGHHQKIEEWKQTKNTVKKKSL